MPEDNLGVRRDSATRDYETVLRPHGVGGRTKDGSVVVAVPDRIAQCSRFS